MHSFPQACSSEFHCRVRSMGSLLGNLKGPSPQELPKMRAGRMRRQKGQLRTPMVGGPAAYTVGKGQPLAPKAGPNRTGR